VPTRTNSPSDVEIDTAARDSSQSTVSCNATQISTFTVANTVIRGLISPSIPRFSSLQVTIFSVRKPK